VTRPERGMVIVAVACIAVAVAIDLFMVWIGAR
jgi:hypothetical protein